MDQQVLITKCESLLTTLNPNWINDPDMIDTPSRLGKMYMHFFRNDDPKTHLVKKFPTNNDQLVIVKDIECFGMCPHHLLPVIYKVHIGYNPNGWALGLSKFARIANAVVSYPKLQENITSEIVDVVYDGLKPNGVIVVVEGIHNCMRCRGVEQKSKVITSALRGNMANDPQKTEDFLNMIKV